MSLDLLTLYALGNLYNGLIWDWHPVERQTSGEFCLYEAGSKRYPCGFAHEEKRPQICWTCSGSQRNLLTDRMNYTPELDCRHLSKWPGFLALSLCRMGSWDFWKSVVPYAGNGMAAFCPLSAQGAPLSCSSFCGRCKRLAQYRLFQAVEESCITPLNLNGFQDWTKKLSLKTFLSWCIWFVRMSEMLRTAPCCAGAQWKCEVIRL